MQLLVAARQLSDHPLDCRGRAVDLAQIPISPSRPTSANRHCVLLLRRVKPDKGFAILLHGPPSVHEARLGPPEQPSHDKGLVKGRITGTSKGLQLLRYPRSKPICATRPVSEHGQPHMRSPLIAAAPRSRFRRAGLRRTSTILESGISGHGLLRFVYLDPPGLIRSWEMTGLRWCIR